MEKKVEWPTVKASKGHLVVPAKAQIGAIEMALAQLKKVRNIPRESSCHGEDFSSKISKESLSSEQSNELTYLQNENKIFKDQLETQSKHKKKMQNMKRLFESNSQQINNQLSIVREAIENQTKIRNTNDMGTRRKYLS